MATGSASVPTPRPGPRDEANAAPVDVPPPAPSRTRRRTVVARGVILFAVFAVMLELTCRIDDRIRFGTPMLSRFTSQGDLMVRDAQGGHGRPNSRFQKWVMNNLGMRGRDATPLPVAGTVRVVTAGASETFGLYESPDHEYPRQLEDSLGAALAAAASCTTNQVPRRVEVLNAALPGMSLPTITQDLRLRVAGLRPDLVVLYATPPQYLEANPPFAARPDSSGAAGDLSWRRALQPRALSRIRDQVKRMLPGAVQSWLRQRDIERALREHPAGWRFAGVPPERLAQFERDLREAVGAIRAAGAEPVLATHTNAFVNVAERDENQLRAWERFYPRAPGAVIVAFDSAANAATRRIARDSSAALADLERTIAGRDATLFADFSHFTDVGAARAAAVLAHTITMTQGSRLCAHTPAPPASTSGP